MNKELLEIVGNGKPTGSVLKETVAVSVTISISVGNRHSRILLRALLRDRMHRKPEVPEAKVPSGRKFRWPCKDYLKGTDPIHSVKSGHPPVCMFHKTKSGRRFGKSGLIRIARVEEQPSKKSKKNGNKSENSGYAEKYTTIGLCIPGYGAAEVYRFCGRAQTYRNQSDV